MWKTAQNSACSYDKEIWKLIKNSYEDTPTSNFMALDYVRATNCENDRKLPTICIFDSTE